MFRFRAKTLSDTLKSELTLLLSIPPREYLNLNPWRHLSFISRSIGTNRSFLSNPVKVIRNRARTQHSQGNHTLLWWYVSVDSILSNNNAITNVVNSSTHRERRAKNTSLDCQITRVDKTSTILSCAAIRAHVNQWPCCSGGLFQILVT